MTSEHVYLAFSKACDIDSTVLVSTGPKARVSLPVWRPLSQWRGGKVAQGRHGPGSVCMHGLQRMWRGTCAFLLDSRACYQTCVGVPKQCHRHQGLAHSMLMTLETLPSLGSSCYKLARPPRDVKGHLCIFAGFTCVSTTVCWRVKSMSQAPRPCT